MHEKHNYFFFTWVSSFINLRQGRHRLMKELAHVKNTSNYWSKQKQNIWTLYLQKTLRKKLEIYLQF